MTAPEALQSVQYVTAKGKRLAVVDAHNREALIEWLETQEDLSLVKQAYAELEAAGATVSAQAGSSGTTLKEN